MSTAEGPASGVGTGAGAGAGAGGGGHGASSATAAADGASESRFRTDGSVLVVNAQIWAWDDEGEAARGKETGYHFNDWMLVCDGAVKEVGTGTPPSAPEGAEVVDAGGRLVLPGLHDAHLHVMHLGRQMSELECHGASSIEELQARVKAFAEANPGDDWLVGVGWEQDVLGRYPTAADLDAVLPSRPVVLQRVCHHIAVLNSAALEAVGYGPSTPDPAGGRIDRDASGAPTGIVREAAMTPVWGIGHKAGDQQAELLAGLHRCLDGGVTAVHTNDLGTWDAYNALAKSHRLPIRVFLTLHWQQLEPPSEGKTSGSILGPGGSGATSIPDPAKTAARIATGPSFGSLFCDRMKVFTDGALGARTAALSLPYVHLPEEDGAEPPPHEHEGQPAAPAQDAATAGTGITYHTPERLAHAFRLVTERGFRLEVHAIGDRAAEQVLDALEAAEVDPKLRPVITHCQVLREDLIARMATAGAVANIQPQFLPSDAAWIPLRIPEPLRRLSYPWQSLLQAGVPCAGGSDAPVEMPDSFAGLRDAVFRPNGPGSAEVIGGAELLSFTQALHLYTDGAAYASHAEGWIGRLEPGMAADFIILPEGNALGEICKEDTTDEGQRRRGLRAALDELADTQPVAGSVDVSAEERTVPGWELFVGGHRRG